MATVTIKHATLTGAAANPDVLVDGPKWDASHTVTGIENVDNTSDLNKPISTATQTALDAKVTGTASALTRTNDTNVTITLGGTPATALLQATSITVGWTGALAETRGGTGKASYAVGDLLYADTTTTLAKLADIATGNALISGGVGVAPSWGKIGLSTHISGFGTGVATALAVNVGSAGAAVVNGGALGTPSSGTLTSCTAFSLTTTGSSGAATYSGGTLNIPQYSGGSAVVPGLLYGLAVSNNAIDVVNDIDITAGTATDSTGVVSIAGTAMTKQLDVGWAPGSAAGMRNSGAAIANTTYHVYLVAKAAGANPDYYAHTSTTVATVITALQAESGGASYIYARRIFSIVRVSAAIKPFFQDGDMVQWVTQVSDRNSTAGAAWALLAITVPLGIKVQPMITAFTQQNAGGDSFVTIGDARDSGQASPVAMGEVKAAGEVSYNYLAGTILSNTSAQIYHSQTINSGSLSFGVIQTRGYIDTRDRL